jgi:polar amino acid transport system substrate-binding protein
MSVARSRLLRTLAPALGAVLVASLAACGGASAGAAPAGTDTTAVTIGALSNGAATEATVQVPVVDSIRATLPAKIRDGGTLTIGLGLLPSGSPPLGYVGTDDKTLTGSEPDLARLVAGVLGLEPELNNATWENLFVGIDSGRTDIGFSNITDTEQRKLKYDFACYRQDNLAFETLASSTWTFAGDPQALAGHKVSVGRGTNQEKILLEWQAQVQAAGKSFDIAYYPDNNAVQLALSSGQIDAYLGPNPGVSYQVTQSASSPSPKRAAGTYSGAGQTLQGLICATAKKDSGLAGPVAAAINYLIQNGQYAKWLGAWHLTDEAVATSEVNPPGLPLDNT